MKCSSQHLQCLSYKIKAIFMWCEFAHVSLRHKPTFFHQLRNMTATKQNNPAEQ